LYFSLILKHVLRAYAIPDEYVPVLSTEIGEGNSGSEVSES